MKLSEICRTIKTRFFPTNPCGEILFGNPEKCVLSVPVTPGGKSMKFENSGFIKMNPVKNDFFDGWTWDDEDDNDLESLCNDTEIKITARQLRGLLNEARKSCN